MRLFIGIPLAAEVIDAAERLSGSCNQMGMALGFAESWHITLRSFLGETCELTL